MMRAGKVFLLSAAGALLFVALLWSLHLNNTGEGSRLCRQINAFGYALHPDDLYPAGTWNNTSIQALLPETALTQVVEVSKSAGFAADIDRTGQVALLMAGIGEGDVITLYLVDGDIQLAFVQTEGAQAVRALGA